VRRPIGSKSELRPIEPRKAAAPLRLILLHSAVGHKSFHGFRHSGRNPRPIHQNRVASLSEPQHHRARRRPGNFGDIAIGETQDVAQHDCLPDRRREGRNCRLELRCARSEQGRLGGIDLAVLHVLGDLRILDGGEGGSSILTQPFVGGPMDDTQNPDASVEIGMLANPAQRATRDTTPLSRSESDRASARMCSATS
jgi:hypothetical protein